MIAFFLELHFAGRSLEHNADNLGHDQVGQFAIPKIFRFLLDCFLDGLIRQKYFLRIPEPDIHLCLERSVLSEENFRRRIGSEQLQTQLRTGQAVVGEFVFVRFHFLCRNGGVFLPVLEVEQQIVHQRSVRLIFDWGFEAPFVVVTADFDFVIAVLNHDPINFFTAEIKNVL